LRILMHGGPAHTPNRRYSDDMLAELGLALPASVAEAGEQLDSDG
ncbi:MAG TPA: glycosyltransferase, partial [Alcanivorax sp.]|nr:glycosyltransferase [Alcanivorax sp.]